MININCILRCFPNKITRKIDDILNSNDIDLNQLEEIRIRANKPIILKFGEQEKIIEYNVRAR